MVSAVWDDDRAAYSLRSPFEARDAIKRGVPWHLREWDAMRKVWWIDPAAIDDLRNSLERSGFRLTVSAPRASAPAVDWVEEAFKACPAESRPRLRRGLMAVFHPDAGGNEDLAKRINAAAGNG